jgi:hypothetical protein
MRKIVVIIVLALMPLEESASGEADSYRFNESIAYELRLYHKLPFSIELLKEYLLVNNFPEPETTLAVFAHETGDFTSNLFQKNNNLSGMDLPLKRKTTAIGYTMGDIGNLQKKAKFTHWTKGADDFMLWLLFHKERGRDPYKTDLITFLCDNGFNVNRELYKKQIIKKKENL